MSHPPLLVVNFQVWAELIFFLIMGFLWLINRIAMAVEAARKPPPRRQMPAPPADGAQPGAQGSRPAQAQRAAPQAQRTAPQGQRPAQPAQPRTASEALQSEIDEFLRRATGRAQPQGQRQRPSARPAVTAKDDSRRGRPAPVVVRTRPALTTSGNTIETPEAISEHVKQFMDTRSFDDRKLSSIDEKERQFDQQVQRSFHELGHLKPSALTAGGDSAVSAAAFQQPVVENVNMPNLLRPVDLRRAIVLNEIFQRPEHRW